jgi:transposase InsO family protein
MQERMRFIADCESGEWALADLCRQYAISRTTAYKWIERYEADPCEGLKDRPRAPHTHPNQVPAEIEAEVVAMKGRHLHWGPLKVLAELQRRFPGEPWPAASTVGDILKRHGLTVARRRRRYATPSGPPLAQCAGANDLWSADFKGWFRTGDGKRCDPLTITDSYSRFLIRCQALTGFTGFDILQPLFQAAFEEYGLPHAIRTDNGPPFAGVGFGGLSRLSVWWMRLGITPQRIRPAHPEENGRHERMHRTLKEATVNPPARDARAQQKAFDRFVPEYNYERPHQALGQRPPAEFYTPSPRPFPDRLPPLPAYPSDWPIRKVKPVGTIKWKGEELFLSAPLAGQRVGFEPIDDGFWKVHFLACAIALFDEGRLRFRRIPN